MSQHLIQQYVNSLHNQTIITEYEVFEPDLCKAMVRYPSISGAVSR